MFLRALAGFAIGSFCAAVGIAQPISSTAAMDRYLFDFPTFYRRLSELGFVIYPGKVSSAECFRIGTIGHIFPRDIRALVGAIRQVLDEMQVDSGDSALESGERTTTRSRP